MSAVNNDIAINPTHDALKYTRPNSYYGMKGQELRDKFNTTLNDLTADMQKKNLDDFNQISTITLIQDSAERKYFAEQLKAKEDAIEKENIALATHLRKHRDLLECKPFTM